MCKRQLPLLAYGPTNVIGATRITSPVRARRVAHVNAPRAHHAWHLRACVRACVRACARAPIAIPPADVFTKRQFRKDNYEICEKTARRRRAEGGGAAGERPILFSSSCA